MAKATTSDAELTGRGIVKAVEALAMCVKRARELPGDGTRVAGYIARELLERGGHIEDGNPNRLRWALTETPMPAEDPSGLHGAVALCHIVSACLRRTGGAPDAVLADAARHWPEHETKAAAEKAVRVEGEARSGVTAREVAAAHTARLAAPARPALRMVPSVKSPKPEGEWAVGQVFDDVPTVG